MLRSIVTTAKRGFMKAGFDFGSKNVSAAIIDEASPGKINTYVIAHNGNLSEAYQNIRNMIDMDFRNASIESYGITGNIDIEGFECIDRLLAEIEAAAFLKTEAANIISAGNETFFLIILDADGNYVEHTVNPLCASGTGSFLEQQAGRLGTTVEELTRIAASFEGKSPVIATRCSVFAKSDIIHAQAEGYSKEAIAAGLCQGIADSIISNLIKGRRLTGNTIFTGGLSNSDKIVGEISKKLGIIPVIPEHNMYFGAIGAALLGNSDNPEKSFLSTSIKNKRNKRDKITIDPSLSAMYESGDRFYIDNGVEVTEYCMPKEKEICVYLGIDIGSTSRL